MPDQLEQDRTDPQRAHVRALEILPDEEAFDVFSKYCLASIQVAVQISEDSYSLTLCPSGRALIRLNVGPAEAMTADPGGLRLLLVDSVGIKPDTRKIVDWSSPYRSLRANHGAINIPWSACQFIAADVLGAHLDYVKLAASRRPLGIFKGHSEGLLEAIQHQGTSRPSLMIPLAPIPGVGSMTPERLQETTSSFQRDPRVREAVQSRAKGSCELCSQPGPFLTRDGDRYLEVHHLTPLAQGGADLIENAAAVCPNCHRELHHGVAAQERTELLRNRVPYHSQAKI